ncbi:hypothetical protein ACPA2L_30590 [Bacillus bombysepticus]
MYSDKQEDIESTIIRQIPALKRMQRQETLTYLQLQAKHKNFAFTKYVVVKNGVFNLETCQLEDFSLEIVKSNKTLYFYIPDAY